jgi:hypothetical protein
VVVLKQILNLIPRGMSNRHSRESGVEAKVRSFGVVSHLAAMLFAQLSHAMRLSDVCDCLSSHDFGMNELEDYGRSFFTEREAVMSRMA